MHATYSPDDNKLRLYPDSRLPRETYDRVKAAGFKWAPKQELFVAPAWTPEREDLLIELCGEISDEDTSLVERAQERAERFEEYSDKREAESARRNRPQRLLRLNSSAPSPSDYSGPSRKTSPCGLKTSSASRPMGCSTGS